MFSSNLVGKHSLVLAGLALAITAMGTTIGTAAAGERDTYPAGMVAAMERDLGIRAEYLPRFFQLQRDSLAREAQARRTLGTQFAGAWLERDATGQFHQVIATTGAGKSVPGASVRQVRHSLRDLEQAMQSLDQVRQRARDGRRLQGVQSWYIDLPSNSVVVSVEPGAMARAIDFVAVSAANSRAIRFERSQGVATPVATVRGGDRYGSGGGSCSIGFAVTRGTTKGFATAGHCGRAGTSVNIGGVAVGSVQAATFPNRDIAWASVRSTDTLVGQVNRYDGSSVPVRGATEYGVGTSICRSGFASGWRCGRVTALNVTVNYSVGPVYGLRQSSACVTQGDSGGSWLVNDQAQGVSSGGQLNGTSNCGSASPVTYYQPLNPLLSAYGLTLVRG